MATDDAHLEDTRLERALRDVAPAVPTADVLGQVTRRRTRRRRTRQVTIGALVLVALLAVGTVAVVATRRDDASTHVAAGGAGLRARVIAGDHAVDDGAGTTQAPGRVTLDQDPGRLRAPILVGAETVSVAGYDEGPQGVATSHVVRIDGTKVIDSTRFKATRVLSIAEGEGARWALTQNYVPTGGTVPDAFLKRILTTGAFTDTQLPQNADPVGPIAAIGGAVWVPVRDGVLQYDSSGAFVRRIPLADADHRSVAQVGKLAYVTDGDQLRSLDPGTGTGSGETITLGPEALGLATAGFEARVLLTSEDGGREHARFARVQPSGADRPTQVTAVMPDGFVADGLAASTTRMWVTGTVDGAPAIVLLGDGGVRATVVLDNALGNAGDGVALAWTDAHTVRVVSGGALYDVALP